MTSVFSWQNSICLCPASFCTPRPNLLLLQVFLDFLLLHSCPHLFWVVVLEGLVGLHGTIQHQLLQHCWSGDRLGLPWYWMVCLGNKQKIILLFMRLHPSTAFWTLVEHDGYSISSKGFLPIVVDIIVIWVKFAHSSPFSSLIPRMLMFTLAISCLTTSNLPWLMDLTWKRQWHPTPVLFCLENSMDRGTL